MSNMSRKDIVRLDCLCVAEWKGDATEQYCARHRGIKAIVFRNAEFIVRCRNDAGSFHYTRKCGTALFSANLTADKHHRRYPTHTVFVMSGDKLVSVRRAIQDLGTLDEIPF